LRFSHRSWWRSVHFGKWPMSISKYFPTFRRIILSSSSGSSSSRRNLNCLTAGLKMMSPRFSETSILIDRHKVTSSKTWIWRKKMGIFTWIWRKKMGIFNWIWNYSKLSLMTTPKTIFSRHYVTSATKPLRFSSVSPLRVSAFVVRIVRENMKSGCQSRLWLLELHGYCHVGCEALICRYIPTQRRNPLSPSVRNSWRWRQKAPPKCSLVRIELHLSHLFVKNLICTFF